MAIFDESIKEEVRARTDIVSVIGRYVNLKAYGQTLKGLCPFHKEKTPSFHVNPAQGFFHCFGCGKGGDVFTFLIEIEGIGFVEALTMLADECGIVLAPAAEDTSGSYAQHLGQDSSCQLSKTELLRIHEIAANFFYAQIKNTPAVVAYFKQRGLQPETVRDFRLGYAPEGWSTLIDYCKQQQIASESLVACGLAIQKEDGRCYDRFRNRIIFPLFDVAGRVIAFAGRGMEEDAIPKYLNSPETLLYKKKLMLFGLHRARPAIKERKTALIVEGYMDYLSLYQAGIQHAVATSGTAFTVEHAGLISRFTKNVTLVFDGDAAGQKAAEKAIFILVPLNLDVGVVTVPGNEDPDSFVRTHGREAFEALLQKSRPWSGYIIERLMTEHNAATSRGKSAVIAALTPLVHSITDSIAVQRFKREIAELLGVDEQTVYKRVSSTASRANGERVSEQSDHYKGYCDSIEGTFLRILFAHPEHIAEARNYVTPETLTDSVSSDIYSLILAAYDQNQHLIGAVDRTGDPEIKRLISLLLVKGSVPEHVHEELVQKILHLRAKFLRFRIRECKLAMKREPHRSTELLHLLQDLLTQLNELGGGE